MKAKGSGMATKERIRRRAELCRTGGWETGMKTFNRSRTERTEPHFNHRLH